MKKFFILILVISSSFISAEYITSHSFFSVRPHFLVGSPERISLFRNNLLQERTKHRAAFEAVFYGSRTSTEGSTKLGKYFLPPASIDNCLNIREYNSAKQLADPSNSEDFNIQKNIEARNFNIMTKRESFKSRVCIKPTRSVEGIGFVYKQSLKFNKDNTTEWYLELSLPIEHVRNNMNLKERIIDNGGGPNLAEIGLNGAPHVGSMIKALDQKSWKHGKISKYPLEKYGAADLNIILGYNYHTAPHAQLSSYFGLIVPTGNKPSAKYMFEPVIGNGHHLGVVTANSIGFSLYNRFGWEVKFRSEMVASYLFNNYQNRSFDLIGKPWGRYLATYKNGVQAAQANKTRSISSGTSGIDMFTGCFKIYPHFYSVFNTAFLFDRSFYHTDITVELGYNLYVRQAENAELIKYGKFNSVAIQGINGAGTTSLARNIRQNFPQAFVTFDENYLSLSTPEIDIDSVVHPATISNTFYGVLGYSGEYKYGTLTGGLGGSYEFTQVRINNAINRWMAWFKLISTF